ncbi:MAG: histidinol-phosphatase HisJ family protein [Provencibacterium sp.]|jgi:histidinol-phosphatase (PHP family)|nr:histidinol-phosphatase HisJ family protein [Provencibacterium sp.]
MLNFFDSHTHSDNSPDGQHSITFMCEKAVEKGLMGIAVTDHCEIDTYEEDGSPMRMLQSVFEVRKAQLAFGGRLMLTAGIELGQPLASPETARQALQMQNYDFVLGSVHRTRADLTDYYWKDYHSYTEADVKKELDVYFNEVLETVRWGQFDVLAHLTYPLRYMEGRDGAPCSLEPHREIMDEILRALARSGKGLELNVSSLYGEYGRTCPTRETIQRFRELGGEIVTIGSDSHRADRIGQGIAEGMEILSACGFEYFAFYKRRAPRMLRIQ